ncbi:MAG: hypothetical protein R3E87_05060 [Burkholderiaceae bacterium]
MTATPSDRPLPFANDLDSKSSLLHTRHGVFYPRGCEVYAFATRDDLDAAWAALPAQAGQDGQAVVLTSEQMQELAGKSHADASAAAEIAAAELKQMDILRDLAQTHGALFLIVQSDGIPKDARASLIERGRPMKGISYGLLIIEELVAEDNRDLKSSPLGINERGH